MTTQPLDLVELGDACAALRAHSLDLFETTGTWVVDTADASHQRWFADAARRHAWHAELWAERTPVIPPVDADALVESHRRRDDPALDPAGIDPDDRAARYRDRLDAIVARLDELESRTVAELDPATVRVIALTRADVVDLRDR